MVGWGRVLLKVVYVLTRRILGVPADERDALCAMVTDVDRQQIRRRPVLSGLINEYTHAA